MKKQKETIGFYEFCEAFERSQYKDNFTSEGLRVIFDYIEECEREMREPIKLDVVAIACDYQEADYKRIADYYSFDLDLDGDQLDEDSVDLIRLYLKKRTTVIG